MERIKYDNNNRLSMLRSGEVDKYYDEKGDVRAFVKDGKIRFYTGLNMFSMRLNDKIPDMIYSANLVEQKNIETYIADKIKEISKDHLNQN